MSEKSLINASGNLFEVLIGMMKMVERSLGGASGSTKRETVLTMLLSQKLINEDQKEPVGVLIDGFIYVAKHRNLLGEFAAKGCTSCTLI